MWVKGGLEVFESLKEIIETWDLNEEEQEELRSYTVLVAVENSYGAEGASIYTLLERDGKFYEEFDSHCSCYGYSNFAPQKTSLELFEKWSPDSDPEIWVKENLYDILSGKYKIKDE